jgi:hypothetical protein
MSGLNYANMSPSELLVIRKELRERLEDSCTNKEKQTIKQQLNTINELLTDHFGINYN